MRKGITFFSAIVVFVCSLFIGTDISSATLSSAEAERAKTVQVYDPAEKANRKFYRFNKRLDKYFLKPVAKAYRAVVPQPVRNAFSRALRNLGEPINVLNAGLQGDMKQSMVSFWRFAINSSIGIGGLFDVAGSGGLPYRKEDFGQTLGKYGLDAGPYLMVPFWGPSNVRDLTGKVIDSLSDPFNYWFTEYGVAARTAGYAVVTREELLDTLDEVERVSLDPYATIRSGYTQRREDMIDNGEME
jgi:phospholipid-binding lipoprotein MlaA